MKEALEEEARLPEEKEVMVAKEARVVLEGKVDGAGSAVLKLLLPRQSTLN